jgi:hypothetical protein
MSTVVTTEKEQIYCLESVVRLNPQNKTAQRGLILLGAREASNDIQPVPPVIRDWSKGVKAVIEPPKNFFQRIWANPGFRILSFVGSGVIVIGLVLLAIFGPTRGNTLRLSRYPLHHDRLRPYLPPKLLGQQIHSSFVRPQQLLSDPRRFGCF